MNQINNLNLLIVVDSCHSNNFSELSFTNWTLGPSYVLNWKFENFNVQSLIWLQSAGRRAELTGRNSTDELQVSGPDWEREREREVLVWTLPPHNSLLTESVSGREETGENVPVSPGPWTASRHQPPPTWRTLKTLKTSWHLLLLLLLLSLSLSAGIEWRYWPTL